MNLRQHKLNIKHKLIRTQINKLNEKYKINNIKYDMIYYSDLQSLQDKCNHDHLILIGHDSHKNYYKCKICDKEISI